MDTKKTIRVIYKCRLCGEIVEEEESFHTEKENLVLLDIANATGVNHWSTHYCKDKGLGITDLQGWKQKK